MSAAPTTRSRRASRPKRAPRVARRYGKPLDYARLGKTFRDGAAFMRHMRQRAAALLAEARAAGAVTTVDACPICGATDLHDCFRCAGFGYRQCGACTHGFVADRIAAAYRERFFRDDAQYSVRNYCDPARATFRVTNIALPKVGFVLHTLARLESEGQPDNVARQLTARPENGAQRLPSRQETVAQPPSAVQRPAAPGAAAPSPAALCGVENADSPPRCGTRPSASRAWLDVGCGSGEILAALREHGDWDALGLELSARDADFGRAHFGVDIRPQTLADLARGEPERRFDVISMFGVLHCVDEPVALLQQAAALLASGGAVALEVGNFESLTRRAVESFPQHPTRSAYHGVTTPHQFTARSLRRALRSCGLAPVAAWHYGADVYELLNQWCFSDPAFAESPLLAALTELADDLQRVIDRRGLGSNMLWIVKRNDE